MRRLLLLTLVGLALAAGTASASLAAVYVAQSAVGSADGSSCANAEAVTFFNTAGNWGAGAGQIGSDTDVHLCGTISTAMTAQGSGTSGHPIVLTFEAGAKLSEAVCPSAGCLSLSGRSFVTIDGGVPCGPTVTNKATCNGIIESTANGSALANQSLTALGINLNSASNIEVKNLVVQNMYVHSSTSDTAGGGCCAPSSIYVSSGSVSNIHVHDSTFHDANWNLAWDGAISVAGLEINDCDIYNSDHDIAVAITTGSTSNILLHDNHLHDWSNWDDTANNHHHDGIHVFSINSGSNLTAYIYNNLVDGSGGTAHTTSALVFVEVPSGGTGATYVFNNVCVVPTGSSWTNGCVGAANVFEPAYAVNVWNNTFLAGLGQVNYTVRLDSVATTDLRNNIVSNLNTSPGDLLFAHTGITADYQVWANGGGTPFFYSSANHSYAQFIAAGFGWGSHDPVGNLFATPLADINNSTGAISTGFAGVGLGVNLCNGIVSCTGNLAPLASDTTYGGRTPTARPATSAWDIGAYELTTDAPSSGKPLLLRIIRDTAGVP